MKEKDDDILCLSSQSSSSSDDGMLIPLVIQSKDKKNMRHRYLTLYDNNEWYHVDAEDLSAKAHILVQAYEEQVRDSAGEKDNETEQGTREEKYIDVDASTETKKSVENKKQQKKKYPSLPETKKKKSEEKAKDDQTEADKAPEPLKLGDLPPFSPLSSPLFLWGGREATDIIRDIEQAYEITTKWRKNVFKLPSGLTGKHFTQELARLYNAYAQKSPQECIALKAAAVITPLLLQQPAGKPSYRKNKDHLERRLSLWQEGKINQLVLEGITVQKQIVSSKKAPNESTRKNFRDHGLQ